MSHEYFTLSDLSQMILESSATSRQWAESLKLPIIGISLSEIGALFSDVQWAQAFPLAGIAISAIGTSILGLWRYWRLIQIEIRMRERQAIEQFVEKLDADRVEAAAGRSRVHLHRLDTPDPDGTAQVRKPS